MDTTDSRFIENGKQWAKVMLKVEKYKLRVFELENELLLRYIASNSREPYSVCKNRIDDICREFAVLFDDVHLHKVWLEQDLRLLLSFFEDVKKLLYNDTALGDILQANEYMRQRDAATFAKGTDMFAIVKQGFEAQHRHNQLLFYIALRKNIILPPYFAAQNFKPQMDLVISMKDYCREYLPAQCDPTLVLDTSHYLAMQIKDLATDELRAPGWNAYNSILDMNTQLKFYNQKSASIQLETSRTTVIAHTLAVEKLTQLQKDHDTKQNTG